MTDAIRQSLDVAIRRLHAAPVVFCLANPVGLQLGGMIVDEELAMPDLDTIAGKADNSLDPGLRPVTRPAEYNDIAALGRFAEHAAGLGQVDLDRQRSAAVTVSVFRGQQGVADSNDYLEWKSDNSSAGLSEPTQGLGRMPRHGLNSLRGRFLPMDGELENAPGDELLFEHRCGRHRIRQRDLRRGKIDTVGRHHRNIPQRRGLVFSYQIFQIVFSAGHIFERGEF